MILFLVLLLSFSLHGATYHVRVDGGTVTQCTGLADAPYPGSGTGLACSWAHPYWALDGDGEWILAGGDTLHIHTGSYMMGYGAPNTDWCDPDGAYDCFARPLPSGPDEDHPTKILGEGWNRGCASPPELWGTERLYHIFSLEGTSHAEIRCLELTDHSGCVEFHSNPAVRCQRDAYPFGDWADAGEHVVGPGWIVDPPGGVSPSIVVHNFPIAIPGGVKPPWWVRARLDWGEDCGFVANISGNLLGEEGAAQFGEVEDHLFTVAPTMTLWGVIAMVTLLIASAIFMLLRRKKAMLAS